MAIQKQVYKIRGMRKDSLIGSGYASQFAYDIKNLRLNTMGDSTTLVWTNEEGTKEEVVDWHYGIKVNYLKWSYTVKELWYDPKAESDPLSPGRDWEAIVDIDGRQVTVKYCKWVEVTHEVDFSLDYLKPIGQCVVDEQWVLFFILDNEKLMKKFEGVKQFIYTFDNRMKPNTYFDITTLQWVIAPGTKYETPNFSKKDYIIKFFYDDNPSRLGIFTGTVLFNGNLNFDFEHPIDTIGFYENKIVKKVYWIDGKNQPRMIDVGMNPKDITEHKCYENVVNSRFDFVREVQLEEKVYVRKRQTGGGLFPPGTVKWLFTYFNEFGQETNVVYDTPLYYPTMGNRACHPDEISGDTFEIDIYNVDVFHNFDYLRVYSLIRTTEGSTPLLRKVIDVELTGDIVDKDSDEYRHVHIIDTNTIGELLDPTLINYVGGTMIVPQTFDQKDNTLFFGNIELKAIHPTLDESEIERIKDSLKFNKPSPSFGKYIKVNERPNELGSFYNYRCQLNLFETYPQDAPVEHSMMNRCDGSSWAIKHFKAGEKYDIGLQLQDRTGKWSSVIKLTENGIECEYKPYIHDYYEPSVWYPVLTCVIPHDIVDKLYDQGFVTARLVCCNPTIVDRTVIAQGVINPTVYNWKERKDGSPHVESSWFFRPNDVCDWVGSFDRYNMQFSTCALGLHYLPFQHDELLCGMWSGDVVTPYTGKMYAERFYDNIELQSIYQDLQSGRNNSNYYVDREILTFHTPELDFDEKLRTLPLENPKMKIVGYVPISGWSSSLYVDGDGPRYVVHGTKEEGFVKRDQLQRYRKAQWYNPIARTLRDGGIEEMNFADKCLYISDGLTRCGSHTMSPGYWSDYDVYWDKDGNACRQSYPFYPFQRNTQLNNWVKDIEEWGITDWANDRLQTKITTYGGAKLNSKVLAHLLVSDTTYFTHEKWIDDIQAFNIVNLPEVLPTKLDFKDSNNNEHSYIYYANVNTIAKLSENDLGEWDMLLDCFHTNNKPSVVSVTGRYRIEHYNNIGPSEGVNTSSAIVRDILKQFFYPSNDPVPVTYKSTIHGVFYTEKLKDDHLDSYLFPSNDYRNRHYYSKHQYENQSNEPYLYLVELLRDVEEDNKFNSQIYIPCGPVVRLDGHDVTDYNNYDTSTPRTNLQRMYYHYQNGVMLPVRNMAGDITLEGVEGDTYYMRYDNLKTYPFTLEDTNQIVEILSFLVESRVNLDGRYDTNRGLTDNTTVTNTNFNYVNLSYTQTNNQFQFTVLKPISENLNEFPNQITWTKTKQSGDEIDQWTNVTLANVADADGICGEITKIVNFKGQLYLFQEKGIAGLGYNEKTAISTQNGVPLEIANSNKFTGFSYISNDVGCQNKWSVSNTRNGLMFIDDHRRQLHILGGESTSTTELSTISDLDSFFICELPRNFKKWLPYDADNFVTYFDNISKDIYWINKSFCIAWNEVSKGFTSFYSYNDVPLMANVEKHFLMWKDNKIYAARENTNQYSWFFDKYEDYWMTLCCDGVMQEGNAFNIDKVFNNIEYRADLFDRVSGLPREPINLDVFNKKAAWNGYQMYKEFDIEAIRKFNTWRVQLPRATYMDENKNIFTNRDRIRGHYSFVKLLNDDAINSFDNTTKGNRMILHDLAIFFDMK